MVGAKRRGGQAVLVVKIGHGCFVPIKPDLLRLFYLRVGDDHRIAGDGGAGRMENPIGASAYLPPGPSIG